MRTFGKTPFYLGLLWLAACSSNGDLARPSVAPGEPGEGFADGGPFFPPPAPQRLGDVVTPSKRVPAISGGTLAVLADGSLAVAADPDRDLVYIVTTSNGAVTKLAMPAASEPSRVALDNRGQAHVVLRGTGEIAHFDLAQKQQVGTTHVCDLPRGIVHDVKGGSLVVACSSGDVVWLSAADHSERKRRFVDHDLRDVVQTGHGLYVSRYRSSELLRLDAEGKILARLAPPASHPARFGGLDPFFGSNAPAANLPVMGPVPNVPGLADQVTMTPTLAWRSVAGPDDTVLTLHQRSQVEEISVQPGGYGGGCATITQPSATLTGEEGAGEPALSMADSTVAVDAALSPDGEWLVVAAPGNYLQSMGTVMFYNAHSNVGGHDRHHHHKPGGGDDKPTMPDAGVSADAGIIGDVDGSLPTDGCGAASYSEGGNIQATSVAYDGAGKLYVQSREPASLTVYTVTVNDEFPDGAFIENVSTFASVTLDSSSAEDTGHDLFHANVGSGLACASCHGEALDDGHVWTFQGIGPRRTQNMRGGLGGTAPFHWDGDLDTFQHLVDNVMTGRMGGFVVEPRYTDALASWIDKQPALKLNARDSASAAHGESLFVSDEVGCTSCHAGTTLTNNLNMDVGTGGMFQVPSLRGLGLRGPYMHDGCAITLKDRFTESCGGNKHGKVAQLSPQDIADLVAYLETL